MGRYSKPLAPEFADFASVSSGNALDVGCGPGALIGELSRRLGASSVSAVDPSASFVEAAKQRYPTVDVRRASADDLPFEDSTFATALAQLVVHFMPDPISGLEEMARVTQSGGIVAACVWDHAGNQGPLAVFWEAARELDPDADDESELPGTRQGHLAELFVQAGLADVEEVALSVDVEHDSFEDWWEPFTLGVGPAGAYTAGLDPDRQVELRELCRRRLPTAPVVISACAWAAKGYA